MDMDFLQEIWPFEKLMASLKRIVHPELIPKFSEQEHDVISKLMVGNNVKCLDLLKIFYKKSNGKLEIYGTAQDMMENIEKLDKIPEFMTFSVKDEKIPIFCAMMSPISIYHNSSCEVVYVSKRDNFINIYKLWISFVEPVPMDQIVTSFYKSWFIKLAEKILGDLEGSYDLIPEDSYNIVFSDLKNSYKSENTIPCPSGVITINWFLNLKRYFDQGQVHVEKENTFDFLMNTLKNAPIASHQEAYKKIYAEISFLLEKAEMVFKRHAELFTPFSKLTKPSIHQKPVVRHLNGQAFDYFLAKELEVSMKLALKVCPARTKLLKDLIAVETEEERKNGIVYAISLDKFNEMLKKLDMSWENLVILDVELEQDFQNMSLPIISSYGTHCIPSLDAFDRIIYYLSVILKVFQRSNAENLKNVFKWIDDVMDSLFVKKSLFYLVEISKIDEIIDKARKELSSFLTEAEYEVPFQPQYTKNDVLREFEKLLRNLGWEKQHFLATANPILYFMARDQITIKNIYTGYSQMVRLYLQAYRPKVTSFIRNQSSYVKLDVNDILPYSKPAQPEPENQTFTGFKKGFLNKSAAPPKKQEPKQEEKMPSCSTENAGNRDQKLREELEKLRKDKNELEGQLEAEKARLKAANEISENEIQQLQEELKKSQKAKTQLEDDMKIQIKKVTVGLEEKVQKAQGELEKSQGANTILEEKLNTMELKNREEIRFLKEDQQKTESEMKLLKEDLGREKAKNSDLEDKSETLEKEREKLKQKVEFLMSENEQLRGVNSKNAEFQQKIKEQNKLLKDGHCELVDGAWYKLHRLCSKYPESSDVKEAKNDVMKMEDCVDEFFENVKKECKKLRE